MAEREQEIFLSEEVDEQIDEYLAPSTTNPSLDAVAQHTVQELQRHFAPLEQDAALQRVWQRFEHRRTTMRSLDRARFRATTQQKRRYRMKQVTSREESSGLRTGRLVAAVIFVALLVGSMAVLFQQRHTLVSGQPKEEKMFALVNSTLYRLDMKTHQQLWHFHVPAGANGSPGTIPNLGQMVNDTYYLTGMRGNQVTLYTLNVASGKVRWQIDIPGYVLVKPVIFGNTVYIALQKDSYLTVEALDSASGAKKWDHHLGNKIDQSKNKLPANYTYLAVIAASDKVVYGEMLTPQGSKWSRLRFVLNAHNGDQQWQKGEETAYLNGVDQGFLVEGVLCVVKEYNNNVLQQRGVLVNYDIVGYDAANGKQLWSKQIDGSPSLFSATTLNGVIYFSTYRMAQGQGNNVYAFSAKDGALIWRYQDTDKNGISAPTVTEKEVFINRYAGQALVALDIASGKIRWTFKFHDNLTVEYPPSADNDKVYLSLPGNVIQILRASDGKQIGSFKVNGKADPNNRVVLQLVE
jgi:outer membrane protein assembly factor BamB